MTDEVITITLHTGKRTSDLYKTFGKEASVSADVTEPVANWQLVKYNAEDLPSIETQDQERVEIPAGTVEAFRIEYHGDKSMTFKIIRNNGKLYGKSGTRP